MHNFADHGWALSTSNPSTLVNNLPLFVEDKTLMLCRFCKRWSPAKQGNTKQSKQHTQITQNI